MPELSIWLDTYDDIYSDFDSRIYTKRRISEDFLEELHMALKYRNDHPSTLILLLPAVERNNTVENEIASSFKEQMRNRYYILLGKTRNTLLKGVLLLLSGLLLIGIVTFFSLKTNINYLSLLLRIALEPASWFMLWTGLDLLIFDFRKIKKESSFYNEISSMAIHFKNS